MVDLSLEHSNLLDGLLGQAFDHTPHELHGVVVIRSTHLSWR